MIAIDAILLDEAIIQQPFLCNTNVCKGACCTVKGGDGAPLLDSEIEDIASVVETVWEYLPERSRSEITQHGAVTGTAGDYSTRCIDDRDCVFVYYERGSDVAQCAIEKAFLDGKTSFRKPLSCHLFPIRVADFNGPYLYYDVFPECSPALKHGAQHQVHIYECVKDALVRLYGNEWFNKLRQFAERSTDRNTRLSS